MIRSALFVLACVGVLPAQGRIVVGAKNFTESAVLAELIAQTIEEHTDLEVERRVHLGGTQICFTALRAGEIDVYAEYTGTGHAVLLGRAERSGGALQTFLEVRRLCRERFDVIWLEPFGFDNTYAIAMREELAERLQIERVSDLVAHAPNLRAGFSVEFGSREDGYPGLAVAYGLDFGSVKMIEHGLAYAAIQSDSIDVMDAYSTDSKLLRYDMRVLEDDREFFPPYHAAPLVRREALDAHPEIETALTKLAFRVTDAEIQRLNYSIDVERRSARDVVRSWLEREGLVAGIDAAAATARERALDFARIGLRLAEHIGLTLLAVVLAALVAIPLGIMITSRPRLRGVVLGVAGVLQTIPSLALLALLIPLLGLHLSTATVALFLYALLPIVRNTYTGLTDVDPSLVDAAKGMGMRPAQILRHVELPLARRAIMAGIRTATVITIGVATLAAFIGAGGLGDLIVEGLYLVDASLIVAGAVPAALLALVADWGLGRLERRMATRRAPAGSVRAPIAAR